MYNYKKWFTLQSQADLGILPFVRKREGSLFVVLGFEGVVLGVYNDGALQTLGSLHRVHVGVPVMGSGVLGAEPVCKVRSWQDPQSVRKKFTSVVWTVDRKSFLK